MVYTDALNFGLCSFLIDFCQVASPRKKQVRCLLHISKWIWYPGSPRMPQLLPVMGTSQISYPAPHPEFSRPGCWAVLPYRIHHPGYRLFVPLGLLAATPDSPVFPPTPPWPSSLWSCLLWTLTDVPASAWALLFTYNKLTSPPHLGTDNHVPFPFYFLSFFLFSCLL